MAKTYSPGSHASAANANDNGASSRQPGPRSGPSVVPLPRWQPGHAKVDKVSEADRLPEATSGSRKAAQRPALPVSPKVRHERKTQVVARAVDENAFQLHCIWRSTVTRLDTLAQHVREGNDIMAASEFARWVRCSGLIKLFQMFPAADPHPVNGRAVDDAVRDLLYLCEEKWSNGKVPIVTESKLDQLNRKLDIIAAHIAHATPVATKRRKRRSKAARVPFRVIAGGAS